MTERQQDAINPPQLHQFGSHFRYWREQRGYSLKEAAGDIMSVSQLSKFETEKISISINKLSDLLMMIGVEINEFMNSYSGQKVNRYIGLLVEKNYDEIAFYYQNFPQYQEQLDYLLTYQKTRDLLIPHSDKKPNHKLVEKILQQTEPNVLESECIYAMMNNHQFPTELLLDLCQTLKKRLSEASKPSRVSFLANIFNILYTITSCSRMLSREGYHQEALDLIDFTLLQINKMPPSFHASFIWQEISLKMQKTYTFLRMGKPTEAFKLKKKIVKALTALDELNPDINFYAETKAAFLGDYRSLAEGRLK